MADKKLSEQTAIAATNIANTDIMHVVDVDDVSPSNPGGTSHKIVISELAVAIEDRIVAAGADTQVIFNNVGTLDGASTATYDGTNISISEPTADGHASTKKYVDDNTVVPGADTQVIFNNAGTLNGATNATYDGTNITIVAPTVDLHAATKKYVDENAGGATVDVSYTPQQPGIKTLYDFNVDSPNTLLLELDNDQSQLQLTHSGGVEGWQSIDSDTSQQINDISGDGTNIVGACHGGQIIVSHDNGATFVEEERSVFDDLFASIFVPGIGFIIAGEDAFFEKSTDGGLNWVDKSPASSFDCTSLAYDPDTNTFIGSAASGRIWKSTNSGESWTNSTIASTGITFLHITFNIDAALPGGKQWVIFGTGGNILTSQDGTAWTARTSGTSEDIYGGVWSGGKYLCCADNGVIRSSTDGQANWSNVATSFSDDLRAMTFALNTWWTVGVGGVSYVSATGSSSSFVSEPVGDPAITTTLINLGTTNSGVYAMGASGVLEINTSEPVFLSFARQSQHAGTVFNTQPSNIDPGCNKATLLNESNFFSSLGSLDINLTHSMVNDSDALIFDVFYQFGAAPSPTVKHVELTLSSKGVDACGGVHVIANVTDSTVGDA